MNILFLQSILAFSQKRSGFLSLIKINDNETAFHGFPSNSAKYFANFFLRGKQMHNKVSFNIFLNIKSPSNNHCTPLNESFVALYPTYITLWLWKMNNVYYPILTNTFEIKRRRRREYKKNSSWIVLGNMSLIRVRNLVKEWNMPGIGLKGGECIGTYCRCIFLDLSRYGGLMIQ